MASERVEKGVAYLRTGRNDLAPLKELGLTADEYNELLAAVRWGYETTPHMKDVVQNLYEQRRAEETAAHRVERQPQARRQHRYGKWVIQRQLSQGGQSHTFLVREQGASNRPLFVLKQLKNLKRLGRFEIEVRAALKLNHPNVVRVVDSDLAAERPYLVTEYCDGGALDELDITADYSVLERLRMFRLICHAVAHAHDQRVIHRDLKPANIFLRADCCTPVVGDFGLCFLTDEDERLTLIDEAIGARWYMAPELEDGRSDDVGPWSDVYSLGKVLYWMMAGKVFNREKHREAAHDLTSGAKSADIFFVYEVLDAAVVADHRQRLQSARELARAVEVAMNCIEADAHVLDLTVPQQCDFCALGRYKPIAGSAFGSATIRNFGLNPAGATESLILACDHCGHVQMFRLDAGQPNAWKR